MSQQGQRQWNEEWENREGHQTGQAGGNQWHEQRDALESRDGDTGQRENREKHDDDDQADAPRDEAGGSGQQGRS